MRSLILIGALLWSGAAVAELPSSDANGWYSWVIDNEDQTVVNVHLQDGSLSRLRIQNHYFNCFPGREPKATDLGIVSATFPIYFYEHGGSQPFIPEIERITYRTIAPNDGNSLGSACTKKSDFHS